MKTKNKVIITGKMLEMADVLKLVQTADCRRLLQTSIVESKNYVFQDVFIFFINYLELWYFKKLKRMGISNAVIGIFLTLKIFDSSS